MLRLGFCVDGYEELAGVILRQHPSGAVVGEVYGARDIEAVQGQARVCCRWTTTAQGGPR